MKIFRILLTALAVLAFSSCKADPVINRVQGGDTDEGTETDKEANTLLV